MPATTNLEWRKNNARYRQLEQIYQRLRDVEQELAQLRNVTGE
jgi:UDP-3-O-[3-hydroxymyristoyl] glucosamine N-acyltransferase